MTSINPTPEETVEQMRKRAEAISGRAVPDWWKASVDGKQKDVEKNSGNS